MQIIYQKSAYFCISKSDYEMNYKTLYVTDLDGTLLTSNSTVSCQSSNIINELAEMGAMLTIATARTPATVANLLEGVRLTLPAIVMTGAARYNLEKGNYENVRYIEPQVVETSLRMFEDSGIHPFVYTLRDSQIIHAFHHAEMSDAESIFYDIRRDMNLKQFHIGECPRDADNQRTVLIFSVGPTNIFEPLAARMAEAIGYNVACYKDIFNEHTSYIEVFAQGVDKSHAVGELAKDYGASRIVAFGDNFNDISMMKYADVGIAVANAYEEVRLSADIVIGSNNEDAVMRWIYKDFTGNEWR